VSIVRKPNKQYLYKIEREETMAETTGIVDVGGGFRGIYACGVLDYCLHQNILFNVGIGVSAGSANLASFAAGQTKRNYIYYTQYTMRKEYASMRNFIHTGSYLDLDYIYGTLSNSSGENPLDFEALMKNPMRLITVATNAHTGEARYFEKEEMSKDRYNPLKASCAIPFVCKPYPIDGIPYYDGALSDPVPIHKAFACGCDKVVLLLTKPRDELRTIGKDRVAAYAIRRRYPAAAQKILNRAKAYNEGVALAKQLEQQGTALIVAPDDTCGIDTLTRDREKMNRLYQKGYQNGVLIRDFLARK
jgi:predicted patatin/cPLA2 family phospholipase